MNVEMFNLNVHEHLGRPGGLSKEVRHFASFHWLGR